MISKKRGPEELPSRALEHGREAFGARFVRPGFASTPELDLAFALGHGSVGMGPVRLLADLAPGKKQPGSSAQLHRNVAIAALRAGSVHKPVAHEEDPAPIDEGEARELVLAHLPKLGLLPIHFRALEAMVGPACVLPAYVEALEAIPLGAWGSAQLKGLFPVAYGLLLRAPGKVSGAARERLEALFKKREDTFAAGNLDILLHGRQGIARCGYKYSVKFKSYQRSANDEPSNVNDLCFCDDDQDFVAAQFHALWAAFAFRIVGGMNGPSPARLFFLGGEKTLETELRVVETYPGTKQAEALESYASLRSPTAARLVRGLTHPKSKVKAQAEAWLSAQESQPG